MARPTTLVTGAGGEMGLLLVPELVRRGFEVTALDLVPLPESLRSSCRETVVADVRDAERLHALVERIRPETVFHLAAILSSKAEALPELAEAVNVRATVALLEICRRSAAAEGRPVRFLFPSSIAVYGRPDAATSATTGAIDEGMWTTPRRLYGCHKLYVENLGRYWCARAAREASPGIDFRALRFPGLISAQTVPSGGTSDYIPEMVHAAARGESYTCFVRSETRLPFMTMPDAVAAFVRLSGAAADRLSRRSYNLTAFNPSAGEMAARLTSVFPSFEVTYRPDPERQAIVDSWPVEVDDKAARRDWGLSPVHDLEGALDDYLLPALRERYRQQVGG